jgi:cytochrome c biogenesis protein CcmG/thiol:disulfide interchange protein DsbE
MTELEFLQETQDSPKPGFRLSLGGIMLLGGILLVALVVGLQLARQGQSQPTAGPAPDFTVTTFDGQRIRLSELRGQIVILNFWASWCGPCRAEAPILESMWRDYRDRGVIVLGVTYADAERDSRAFIAEMGMTYPNAPDVGTFISRSLYHITGVPETFIIDQRGEIARFLFADINAQRAVEVRALLDDLLARGAS